MKSFFIFCSINIVEVSKHILWALKVFGAFKDLLPPTYLPNFETNS